MNHLVMFSGGLSSWATGRIVVDRYGAENVTLLFANTRIEDEDLYHFIREASEDLGVPLTVVEDGRTPWQVFEDVKFIGNSGIDPCSRVLKRELLDAYRDLHFKPHNTTVYLGLGWWEAHRIERVKARCAPWRYECPLGERLDIDPDVLKEMVVAAGMSLPRMYAEGFSHHNCGGFCIKAGQAQFARLLRWNKPRYLEHENEEQRLRDKGINGTVLNDRRTVDGKVIRTPLTMRDFRLRLEYDPFGFNANDEGGCGCAVPGEDEDQP